MKSKRVGVAKVMALAALPICLALDVSQKATENATRQLFAEIVADEGTRWDQVEVIIPHADPSAHYEHSYVDVRHYHWVGTSLLQLAIAQQAPIRVTQMLLDQGADPNVQDKGGMNPLKEAVRQGDTDTIRLLLSRGAHVNAEQDKHAEKYSALSLARECLSYPSYPNCKNYSQIIQLLKAAGAKE